MSYITVEQSEFDGPGAGVATEDGEGDFAGCDLLRAWMGDDDDRNSIKMERIRDCFIIAILSLKCLRVYCFVFVIFWGNNRRRGLYIYKWSSESKR